MNCGAGIITDRHGCAPETKAGLPPRKAKMISYLTLPEVCFTIGKVRGGVAPARPRLKNVFFEVVEGYALRWCQRTL